MLKAWMKHAHSPDSHGDRKAIQGGQCRLCMGIDRVVDNQTQYHSRSDTCKACQQTHRRMQLVVTLSLARLTKKVRELGGEW